MRDRGPVQTLATTTGTPPDADTREGTDTSGAALARDHRYGIAAAGEGRQGVGIEVMTPRPADEWRERIGGAHTHVLDELVRHEPLDRAAARVRAVQRCLAGAVGSVAATLSEVRRQDDAVLFRARNDDETFHVLTAPLTFTLGPERMLATLVDVADTTPSPIEDSPSRRSSPTAPDPGAEGYAADSCGIGVDVDTRQFVLRWPVTFRECANLDRTTYATAYADWMGRVRETGMQPIAQAIGEQMATGRWGMVTNSSEIRVVGAVSLGDVVEGRLAVARVPESPDATIDLVFDWRRVGPSGSSERVAIGEMRTTWVELIGHGQVRAAVMPDFFQRFVDARTPPEGLLDRVGDVGARQEDLGAVRYQTREGPRPGPELARRHFDTCLADANLVGNIYFSNYYTWQSRLVEHYVHAILPEVYRGEGPAGELRCVHARVDHLVDVMPFERIEVAATVEALRERGLDIGFAYFRVRDDGSRQKLAFGRRRCVWLERRDGGAVAVPLPQPLADDLAARVTGYAQEEMA